MAIDPDRVVPRRPDPEHVGELAELETRRAATVPVATSCIASGSLVPPSPSCPRCQRSAGAAACLAPCAAAVAASASPPRTFGGLSTYRIYDVRSVAALHGRVKSEKIAAITVGFLSIERASTKKTLLPRKSLYQCTSSSHRQYRRSGWPEVSRYIIYHS